MGSAFRMQYGLSASQYATVALQYHLIPFLVENYELLHYYSNDYVISDMLKYIHEQGGNLDA